MCCHQVHEALTQIGLSVVNTVAQNMETIPTMTNRNLSIERFLGLVVVMSVAKCN